MTHIYTCIKDNNITNSLLANHIIEYSSDGTLQKIVYSVLSQKMLIVAAFQMVTISYTDQEDDVTHISILPS